MILRPLTSGWQAAASPDAAGLRTSARSRALTAGLAAAAAAALFPVYDRLSATAPITADSANALLQGQSLASGNVLLRGWTLSGASFYATDLPFDAAAAGLRGLTPAAAHDVGAAIYTLLVVCACLLAWGRATGREAAIRVAVTLALLIAPTPGVAAQLLLLGPFHVGTALLLLVVLLVLDRAGETHRGALLCGTLLALAVVSDALAVYVGVIPVMVVAGLRLAAHRDNPGPDRALLVAAGLSVPASLAVTWALHQAGGYATVPLQGSFATIESVPRNVALTVEGALLLFGANFFGQPLAAPSTLAILLHLAGFGLVVAAFRHVAQAWRRGDEVSRLDQVLVVGMTIDLAAYLFSNEAIDLMTSRYLIPFMAFGAVLAGRVGGAWLLQPRLQPLAAAGGAMYLLFLGVALASPPAPLPESQLAAFLAQRHLAYGVAGYWQASTITVDTGGAVRVRAVDLDNQPPSPYLWEAEGSWYDPGARGNDARFALRDTQDPRSIDQREAEAAFGPPVAVYHVSHYDVLVWDRNLLGDLGGGR